MGHYRSLKGGELSHSFQEKIKTLPYSITSHTLIAKRLEKVLPKVINPDQTRYTKSRYNYRWKRPFNFRLYDIHRREKHKTFLE